MDTGVVVDQDRILVIFAEDLVLKPQGLFEGFFRGLEISGAPELHAHVAEGADQGGIAVTEAPSHQLQ